MFQSGLALDCISHRAYRKSEYHRERAMLSVASPSPADFSHFPSRMHYCCFPSAPLTYCRGTRALGATRAGA